jgi:hypothetical protein
MKNANLPRMRKEKVERAWILYRIIIEAASGLFI